MRVAPPRRLPLRAPAEAAGAAGPAAAAHPGRTIALVAVHGMGQQLHFETIQDVVDGLLRVEAAAHHPPPEQVGRIVQMGDRRLARAEIQMHDAAGGLVSVHVYEGYWAPLTEGQISLWETMKFLLSSAVAGFLEFFDVFQRYLFGQWRNFGRHMRVRLLLAVLGCFILSLLAFNTALATMAGRMLALDRSPGSAAFLAFTQQIGFVLLLVVLLGALLWVSHVMRGRGFAPARGHFASQVPALVVLAAAILATTAVGILGVLVQLTPSRGWAIARWETFLSASGLHGAAGWVTLHPVVMALVWAATAWASFEARYFLLEYVGDVAIYVSANRVNRFARVREQVKSEITAVMSAVYAAAGYDGVIVVGHSLGSVIAYDALNALITEELLAGATTSKVVGRTRLFVTFGSPLNKTAFLFDTKLARSATTRALLSAAVQPLITDAAYRTFPWDNLWSPADFISGKLGYYESETCRIREFSDPAAVTLLWAHEEYWQGTLLFERIRAAL